MWYLGDYGVMLGWCWSMFSKSVAFVLMNMGWFGSDLKWVWIDVWLILKWLWGAVCCKFGMILQWCWDLFSESLANAVTWCWGDFEVVFNWYLGDFEVMLIWFQSMISKWSAKMFRLCRGDDVVILRWTWSEFGVFPNWLCVDVAVSFKWFWHGVGVTLEWVWGDFGACSERI